MYSWLTFKNGIFGNYFYDLYGYGMVITILQISNISGNIPNNSLVLTEEIFRISRKMHKLRRQKSNVIPFCIG